MSDDGGDEDKQYDASQKKLDDARKKGEIPRSADLTTAATYGGFLLAAVVIGPSAMLATGTALSVLLGQADSLSTQVFVGPAAPMILGLGTRIGGALLPLVAIPALLAILALIAQRGLIVAPDKLAPTLSRISIVKGFGNKFGRNGLFEFAKSTVKLILYSIVLALVLTDQFPRIMGTVLMSPGPVTTELLQLCMRLLAIVLLVAIVLGAVDYLWQRAEHLRKHKMSRKEVMDEHKQSEGDPTMKQHRRQMGYSLAMNRMLADVPEADVIIVNPTHYAVALKWEKGKGRAPVCVAKGVDEIAARIREIATLAAIPIHSDPPTARALHATVEIGDQIRPDHYRAVAAAIRFAESMRQRARGR